MSASINDSSHLQTFYPPQLEAEEDFKASYDDLIDDYSAPYSRTSRHGTFAIDVPSSNPDDIHPGASYPLGQKHFDSHESSFKQSQETDRESQPHPTFGLSTDLDPRSFWEKILPESMACRLYVMTVLIQTTIDLAIEGSLLVQVHESEVSHKMSVYLSIFVLAHVFQFVMAVDAVYARNTLQFIALTVFNALFLVYAIIQIGEIHETLLPAQASTDGVPITDLTTTIPIVIAIAEVAYIGLGWKIYLEFGWKVYKFIGADRRIKKLYANYQIFQCLVKFDVFFSVGFSVQFISIVLQTHDWEFYVTCAALPLSLILLVEGHLAARHENKWMMATFMSGCVAALVYFVYKLVKVVLFRSDTQYRDVWKSLTTFSLIAICLLIVTFGFAILVMRNFRKGLKEALDKRQATLPNARPGVQNPRRAMNANPYRMSID